MRQSSGREPVANVIIVNWNGCHHLAECLPSLLSTRFSNFQVTVLDNGSTDDSLAWLAATHPNLQTVALGCNLGFASANNIGIRLAVSEGADYVVLLNNDTRVDPHWLSALVAVAEECPDVAICHAQQRTWNGRHDIHFKFIPEWVEAQVIEVPVQDPGPPTESIFAAGCAMLLRSEALRRIGLFDERYFAYIEDIDLSIRAWIAGHGVMLVPQSIVYHRFRTSATSRQCMLWGYRNGLTTLLKLYQVETWRTFARPILRRWFWTRNRFALRGTLGAIAMLPGTMDRRARVQRLRTRSDADILALCNH